MQQNWTKTYKISQTNFMKIILNINYNKIILLNNLFLNNIKLEDKIIKIIMTKLWCKIINNYIMININNFNMNFAIIKNSRLKSKINKNFNKIKISIYNNNNNNRYKNKRSHKK